MQEFGKDAPCHCQDAYTEHVQEIPWGSGDKQQRRRNMWMEIVPPAAKDAPLLTSPKQVGAKKWPQVPVSRFAAVEWVCLSRLPLALAVHQRES